MKFDTLIFLVIAFNVIAAILNKRKKKNGAPEPDMPEGDAPEARTILVQGREISPEGREDAPPVENAREAERRERPAPAAEPVAVRAKPAPLAEARWGDPRDLRQAWILKEILDKPVSMRRK